MVALSGVEANLFVMRHGHSLFGVQDFRQKQRDELGSTSLGWMATTITPTIKMQTPNYSRTILDKCYPELAGIDAKYARQWEQEQPLSVYRAMQQIVTEQIGRIMPPRNGGRRFACMSLC